MAIKIEGLQPPFIPIGGVQGLPAQAPQKTPTVKPFREILQEQLDGDNGIKFSAHAKSRMQSRNINLNEQQFAKLNQAVDKAKTKGAHDSLILMNDFAFIVNIDKRTVITAMDKANMNENVFTNIDSAITINDE